MIIGLTQEFMKKSNAEIAKQVFQEILFALQDISEKYQVNCSMPSCVCVNEDVIYYHDLIVDKVGDQKFEFGAEGLKFKVNTSQGWKSLDEALNNQ